MEGVCRLCCSGAGVTHDIFDEQKSTYLKLSTCLPVKVLKDDQLPQKICNRCNGRLDDYYQFCSEAIASQSRLRQSISVYAPDKMVPEYNDPYDLSTVKQPDSPVKIPVKMSVDVEHIQFDTKYTQTEELEDVKVSVKVEKTPQIKTEPMKNDDEAVFEIDDLDADFIPSDYSDDISLKLLKKKKKKKREKVKTDKQNGEVKKRKRRKNEEFSNGVITKSENEELDSKLQNFGPGVSFQGPNGLQIKQEWMNVSFEPGGILDAVATQYLETSLIKTEDFMDEAWYCCVCFAHCSNKNDMIAHYRSHVPNEDLKLEADCKPDMEEVAAIAEDAENNTGASYKCKLCEKVFNRKYTMEKHMLVHEDRRPYRCSLCEKTFRDVNQILKHGRTHSYETPQTMPVAECVVEDCPTALKGELCPDEHLVVRPRTHPQPLSKRFVCDLCDEGFVYMRYLIEHRNRTHPEARERKFVNRCMHCSREFAHLNSLRRHLRSHTGERNFLCNVCGKALSSREHLKFHIRIHTGYKPNVCKTCGKGFVKKCNLTLHERVHSGEKPHVCSHCGKAFSQRSTLVIHERYHSGARPYVCTLCGKGFVAKGLLSMHLKTTCI